MRWMSKEKEVGERKMMPEARFDLEKPLRGN